MRLAMRLSNRGVHHVLVLLSSIGYGISYAVIAVLIDWIAPTNYGTMGFFWGRHVKRTIQQLLSPNGVKKQRSTFAMGLLGSGIKAVLFIGGLLGIPGEHSLAISGGAECIAELINRWLQYLQSEEPYPYGHETLALVLTLYFTLAYWCAAFAVLHPWQVAMLLKWLLFYVLIPLACMAAGLAWLILGQAGRNSAIKDRLLRPLVSCWFYILDLLSVLEAQVYLGFPEYLSGLLALSEQRKNAARQLSYYYHGALSTEKREIRLLVLEKGTFLSGMVKAHMIHTPLADAPPYEAISYHWGNSDLSREILINGRRYAVTQSAYSVLQARRSVWKLRALWIDAICINQTDEQEKSHQVWMMKDIYQRASLAIVWLGGGWKPRLAAALVIEVWTENMHFDGSNMDFEKWYHFERYRKYAPRWNALIDLFYNPYFSRVWVVQEVVVSQKVHLYYGGQYILWDLFSEALMECFHPVQRDLLSETSVY